MERAASDFGRIPFLSHRERLTALEAIIYRIYVELTRSQLSTGLRITYYIAL
jgi:hypothetical protein